MSSLRIVDAGGPHERVTIELMRRLRLLEQSGVAIERSYVTNGADAAALLQAGQADAAMQVGFGPALVAIEGGAPLRLLAGSNLLTVHALYSRCPDIRRLRDLPGRTVGVGKLGALTHQLVYAALRKQGIDPATVRFVPIGNSATVFRALLAGEVDAGFGETDVFEDQAHHGVHALHDGVLWRELPEFPNQASYATLAAIRERRDELVRLLAAHARLYRFLHDPGSWDDYAAAWSTALPGSTRAQGRVQWNFYQSHHPFAGQLQLPAGSLHFLQELNVGMGLQERVMPDALLVDASLARDALRMIDGGP